MVIGSYPSRDDNCKTTCLYIYQKIHLSSVHLNNDESDNKVNIALHIDYDYDNMELIFVENKQMLYIFFVGLCHCLHSSFSIIGYQLTNNFQVHTGLLSFCEV